MSTLRTIVLSDEQHNAVLEAISFAMERAEADMDSNSVDDLFDAEEGWIPQEELYWLKVMPGTLQALNEAGEGIHIAERLSQRLERLKPMHESRAERSLGAAR